MLLAQGTDYVLDNELALGLFEMNLQSPYSKGFHRYQIIHVIRNDKPAEFRRDMGTAKKNKVDQFRIPSFMVHTVRELMDMADDMRGNPPFDKLELAQVDKIKT